MPAIRKITMLLIALLLAAASNVAPAEAKLQGPSDAQELEAFLDGVIDASMTANHVPGAAVSVVKDGSLLFSKGYGYADREQHTPVDPARTLFRAGSVSKLFIWTAVMQQVEQGKLSLDEDVNKYLDFTIPATYPEPVTLKHLMTHTPGFEDVILDLFKIDPADVQPLDVYLKTHVPARVFPPGKLAAYSNYGAALAGYIVERVSGMPFTEYVEKNIFTPLEMKNSTFRQPLPEALSGDMSGGYNFYNGGYRQGSFEFIPPYPAGSLSTSAEDIAKFMLAHLQNGGSGQQRILQEDTARLMHEQLYTPDPRMPGNAHGFFESEVNGQRIISHTGDTLLFHSGLFLLLDQNTGIFITTNGAAGSQVVSSTIDAFMDHYYPVDNQDAAKPAADLKQRYDMLAGEYTMARSNFSTPQKVFGPLIAQVNLSWSDEGYLVISAGGQMSQYVEIDPGLFRERYEPSNQFVVSKEADGGVLIRPAGPNAFIKTPWYGRFTLHMFLVVAGILFSVVTIGAWLVQFISGLRKREPRPWLSRLARLAAAAFCLLFLFFLFSLASIFSDIDPGYGVPRIVFASISQITFLNILPVILTVLAVLMVGFAVLAWVKRYWHTGGRVYYSLLTLMALVLVWVMVYWNFV